MLIPFPNSFEVSLRKELKSLGYTKEQIKRAILLTNENPEPEPPNPPPPPKRKSKNVIEFPVKAKVIDLSSYRKAA